MQTPLFSMKRKQGCFMKDTRINIFALLTVQTIITANPSGCQKETLKTGGNQQ